MSVQHIEDEEDYKRQLIKAGPKLVVADFTAEWCGPCKMIAPVFESLSKKYKSTAVFLKVDVDRCQEVAASANIKAMPTFVFYKNKTEIDRIRGADSSALELKVKELADSVCSFSGSGQRLGGEEGTLGSSSAPDTGNLQNNNVLEAEANAQKAMAVDTTSPVTNIQIRLSDGTKLTLKINMSQPVSKIRKYICIARPSFSALSFALMTTFPSKEITNEDMSVEEAKLANSVVVVKLK